jgi:hypothetical protein
VLLPQGRAPHQRVRASTRVELARIVGIVEIVLFVLLRLVVRRLQALRLQSFLRP